MTNIEDITFVKYNQNFNLIILNYGYNIIDSNKFDTNLSLNEKKQIIIDNNIKFMDFYSISIILLNKQIFCDNFKRSNLESDNVLVSYFDLTILMSILDICQNIHKHNSVFDNICISKYVSVIDIYNASILFKCEPLMKLLESKIAWQNITITCNCGTFDVWFNILSNDIPLLLSINTFNNACGIFCVYFNDVVCITCSKKHINLQLLYKKCVIYANYMKICNNDLIVNVLKFQLGMHFYYLYTYYNNILAKKTISIMYNDLIDIYKNHKNHKNQYLCN